MRNRVIAAVLLLAALLAGWSLLSHAPRSRDVLTQMQSLSVVSQAPPVHLLVRSNPVLATGPESPRLLDPANAGSSTGAVTSVPIALAELPPGISPTAVLDQMRIAINLYASMLGENPVGTNLEITRALNGGNRRHVKFLRPEAGLRLNDRGELVDAWGTPFFFHQLSGHQMEIRSAGPDHVLWTPDDLVVR